MLTEEQIERNKQFIAVLRSGKYEQTTGALRRCGSDGEYSYCCLGVACEVKRLSGTGDGQWDDRFFNGSDEAVPHDVVEYYGWPDQNPVIPIPIRIDAMDNIKRFHEYEYGTSYTGGLAAAINDAGASFAEIADSFEKQLAIEIARTA